jgi:hypothetical protein
MTIKLLYFAVMISLIGMACNATRVVKPVEKGKTQVGVGLGGAMIKLGSAVTPLPLTSVHLAHGMSTSTTAFGSIHTTALLFGVIQTDLGITHELCRQNGFIPGISVSPIANLMLDTWKTDFSFYPQADVNFYWNYGAYNRLAYVSLNNWFELRTKKAHGETQQTHWLPSVGIGHQWNRMKYNWQVEVKYLAPTESNRNIVVDYISPSSNGALGIYIGVSRNF